MAQNSGAAEMETEKDHRVKVKSKKVVTDQLEKYGELVKKLLDGQSGLSEEIKRQLQQSLLKDFERGVQENVLVNGKTWEDATDEPEEDGKILDDLLDDTILETASKRSSYPKKILPHVVRSLKAERELMGLYKGAVKPQEMKRDPEQETIMSNLLERKPKITRQATSVMKSLQDLQRQAAGVCQVLRAQPSAEAREIHGEVFGTPGAEAWPPFPRDRVVRTGRPLRTAALEAELSGAYPRSRGVEGASSARSDERGTEAGNLLPSS